MLTTNMKILAFLTGFFFFGIIDLDPKYLLLFFSLGKDRFLTRTGSCLVILSCLKICQRLNFLASARFCHCLENYHGKNISKIRVSRIPVCQPVLCRQVAEARYFKSIFSVHDPQNATKNQTSFGSDENHKTDEIASLKINFSSLISICNIFENSREPVSS